MKIIKVWFDTNYIYAQGDDGKQYKQSLLWYKRLFNATDEQRNVYTIGFDGIHWRNIDEDISFESFSYNDSEPTQLQRFFLTHKELNISEFAKRININPTLLNNYINGWKTPSSEREAEIFAKIKELGEEYCSVIDSCNYVAEAPAVYGK